MHLFSIINNLTANENVTDIRQPSMSTNKHANSDLNACDVTYIISAVYN